MEEGRNCVGEKGVHVFVLGFVEEICTEVFVVGAGITSFVVC